MKITVQYLDTGMPEWGTINYLTGENTGVSEATGNRREAELQRLRDRALKMAGDWGKVFPNTKFRVNEA